MVLFTPTILLDCPNFCLVCPLSVVQSLSYIHGLQHIILPCPSLSPRVVHQVSNAIQPSHPLFSPSPPAFNRSQQQGFFPMSRLFASGGQSVGALASASALPINIQGWFPLGWTGLISLQSRGLFKSLLQHQLESIDSLGLSFFICSLYEKDYGKFIVLETTPETRVIQSYYKHPKCCLLLSSEAEARERNTPDIKVFSFACG